MKRPSKEEFEKLYHTHTVSEMANKFDVVLTKQE